MGCTSSSASSAPKEKEEDPFEKRLREKREKNISEAKAKELPLLQPKGHRVVAAGTVGDNVRDNTGTSHLATQLKSTRNDATVENIDGVQFLLRAAVQRWQAKYDHFSPPAGFVCECRVSKRTEQWDWMTRKQCEQWCAFGDLTVREAEKIMKEHGIDDVDGMTRLARVYAFLDTGSPDLDDAESPIRAEGEAESIADL